MGAGIGECREWARRLLGPFLLLVAVVMLFHRVFLGESLFFRDLYLLHLPLHARVAGQLLTGHLPLWDPLLHGGQPGALEPQVGLFSPAFVPFLLLPPITALNVVLVAWVLGAALAAFHLGRRLGFSDAGSVICAAGFALSGYTLSAVNLFLPLMGFLWIPLAASTFLRFVETGRTRWIAATAVVGAMPLLAGSLEAEFVLQLFLWLLAFAPPAGVSLAMSRRIAGAAAGLALSVALSGIQLLPSIAVLRDSTRASGFSSAVRMWNSVDPRRLPELVLPGALGPTDTLNDEDYWGHGIVDGGYPLMLSLYVGVSALSLALAGAFSSRSHLPRALRLSLFGLIVVALLFSLGRHIPFLGSLPGLMAPMRLLRYPVKAFTLITLGTAVLAGAGADVVSSPEARRKGLPFAVVGGLVLAPILLLGLKVALGGGSAPADEIWFGVALRPAQRLALGAAFLHALFFGLLAYALVARRSGRDALGGTAWALAVLVLADLTIAGARLNPTAPRSLFARPSLADAVAAVAREGRLFRDGDPRPFRVPAPSNTIRRIVGAKISLLSDYVAAGYGIPVVFHVDYDGMAPVRVARLGDRLRPESWTARLAAFQAAGVTAVLTWDRVTAPGYIPQGEWKWAPRTVLRLYAIEGSGGARFASRAIRARDAAEARDLLLSKQSGPASRVILEGVSTAGGGCNGGNVRVERPVPETLRALVTAPCRGWAVFPEVFAAGWVATVDGVQAPIIPADSAFRAVAVSEGTHVVEMHYEAPGFWGGLSLSAGAGLVLLLLCAERKRPNSRAGGTPIAPRVAVGGLRSSRACWRLCRPRDRRSR